MVHQELKIFRLLWILIYIKIEFASSSPERAALIACIFNVTVNQWMGTAQIF